MWKVGDIAILQNSTYPENDGKEVEILREAVWTEFNDSSEGMACRVSLVTPSGGPCSSKLHQLKKLPPADKKTEWSECLWQPSLIEA